MDIEIKGIVFTPLCRTLRWKLEKKLEESKSPIPCDIQYWIINLCGRKTSLDRPLKLCCGGAKLDGWKIETGRLASGTTFNSSTDLVLWKWTAIPDLLCDPSILN